MIETVKKIESAFRELSLTDPSALGSVKGDYDKKAHSIVEDCVRALEVSVADRLRQEYFGLGAIAALVGREEITEIIINGRDSIWFEIAGALHRHNDQFITDLTFNNCIQRLCREANVQP